MNALENIGNEPTERGIASAIHAIATSTDVDTMEERIIEFVYGVGFHVADALEIAGDEKAGFITAHTLSKDILSTEVKRVHNNILSPDTVRSYFFRVAIPNLIHNASVAFSEQEAERERQAILPYITFLYQYATEYLRDKNDDLSKKARQALEASRAEIGKNIKKTWTLH